MPDPAFALVVGGLRRVQPYDLAAMRVQLRCVRECGGYRFIEAKNPTRRGQLLTQVTSAEAHQAFVGVWIDRYSASGRLE
jgi:hypothetical protein